MPWFREVILHVLWEPIIFRQDGADQKQGWTQTESRLCELRLGSVRQKPRRSTRVLLRLPFGCINAGFLQLNLLKMNFGRAWAGYGCRKCFDFSCQSQISIHRRYLFLASQTSQHLNEFARQQIRIVTQAHLQPVELPKFFRACSIEVASRMIWWIETINFHHHIFSISTRFSYFCTFKHL